MAMAKSKPMLLSPFLGCLTAALVGVYWPIYLLHPSVAILGFRIAMFATCMTLCVLWWRLDVTRAERELAGILAIVVIVAFATSWFSINPERALLEWLKLLIISGAAIGLCRALRHAPTAKAFSTSLIIASGIIGALILTTYLRDMGLVAPTYEATRAFKGHAENQGISLNSIAFDCMFSYVCGMCLVRGTRKFWLLGLVLLAICSALTGSRAPLATSALSGLILLTINALRSRRLLIWAGGALLAFAMVWGPAVAVVTLKSSEMSAFTEGRWGLWSVALQKFAQRPLLGYGFASVDDDPIPYTVNRGGYHSEYFTLLAEQGVLGTTAVLGLFVFLLRRCWGLAFHRSYTWQNGQWALLGCLILFLRAGVEIDGLFGIAKGPGDFLAYILVAIVVNRFSREEDYVTANHGTYGSASRALASLSPIPPAI